VTIFDAPVYVEARQARLRNLFAHVDPAGLRGPGPEAHAADLESWDPGALGRFDAVLCFGLLYHLSAPARFLAACARIAPMLYLETVALDAGQAVCLTVDEAGDDQAFSTRGCRPSPSWITDTLAREGFSTRDISSAAANWGPPAPSIFDWTIEDSGSWMRGGALLRRMFIARRTAPYQPPSSTA